MGQRVSGGWVPVQEQGPAVGVAYASVAPRLGALFVDAVLYFVVMIPIYLVLESVAGMQQDSSESILLVFGVAFGYFTLSWALNHGQTPGSRGGAANASLASHGLRSHFGRRARCDSRQGDFRLPASGGEPIGTVAPQPTQK
jgi:RDD family